jgi:para-aminobenzoate synthetase component I
LKIFFTWDLWRITVNLFDHPEIAALENALIGVHTEPLESGIDMPALAERFAPAAGTVLLLSGGKLDCARHHILGIWPWLTVSGRTDETILTIDHRRLTLNSDPLAVLHALMTQLRLPAGSWPPPLAAGLLGYMAYDLKDSLEKLPRTSVDESDLPRILLYAPSILVVQDKTSGRTRLLAPLRVGMERDTAARVSYFRDLIAKPYAGLLPAPPVMGALRANFSRKAYEQAVQRVIDYIAAGDVYQVNLSQRFQAPFSGDPFTLFRRFYDANPAPFFAFIQGGDHQILSTSPERFLHRRGEWIEARPIKGTRPRGRAPIEDAALRAELAESAKDDAELAMIVDLLRNDLGKVCAPGSVQVAEHKRIEAYENVYHLVSRVEGRLSPGQDSVDLIAAAFPGGSITGCPKVRAMEIIDELEPCRRHVYCGSIGYLGFDGNLDLSIAIRTAVVSGGRIAFSVGGGIVYDSDPGLEYEETLHKGETLMSAVGSKADTPPAAKVWLNGRIVPADEAMVPLTDLGLHYGHGFFETLRSDRGRLPLLTDHIARLERTWQVLLNGRPPDLSWETIIANVLAVNGLDTARAAIKLVITHGSRTEPPWDRTLLVTARPYVHRLTALGKAGLALRSYPEPRLTPLAKYKTLNYLYYHLAAQWASRQACDEALILNPDGTISETNTASLILINGNEAVQPVSPAALPGVMAQAVIRQLMVWDFTITQRPVRPAELLVAQQVLATNALMGAVPVIALDGRERPIGGNLWRQLNDAVIPGWD